MDDSILELELRLQNAMLTSNVDELDLLIHDKLVFIGPDSKVYTKEDDLRLYASGKQRISHLQILERDIQHYGTTAVCTVGAELAGEFLGAGFSGRFRYLRIWHKENGPWRVIGGSVCPIIDV